MSNFKFKIIKKSKKDRSKVGIISTTHGKIRTPAFVAVATAASIKSITPVEFKATNLDVFFVNTYHMMFRPGIKIIKKFNGLHDFMNWSGPIMTDSGGFQVFSLGENGPRNSINRDKLIVVNDKGVKFKSVWDGKELFIGPKESISYQLNLNSDIMMSFDECTSYPITKKKAEKAMIRTHKWALEGIDVKKNSSKNALYGIIQGSIYKDLRIQSAKFISNLNFDGYAIGSVANSKEPRNKVFQVLDWTMDILTQENKPVHFLGIGEVEDIFLSIKKGIDSFDCVTPTRLARMGHVFLKKAGLKNKFRYDITKAEYSHDKSTIDKTCNCYTCCNYTKSYLNHLFRNKELLAYRLATIHNLSFFGNLMNAIRESIINGKYQKLMDEWLNIY